MKGYRPWKRSDLSSDPRLTRLEARFTQQAALKDYIDDSVPPAYFDYDHQAWVVNGRYKSCAHPGSMNCHCYGRIHAGELALETSAKKG